MKGKISDGVHSICMAGVKAIGIFMMAYLFLLSIFSTSIRSIRNNGGTAEEPKWDRYIYFFRDQPVFLLFILALFVAALFLGGRICKRWKMKSLPSAEVLCAVYFGLLVLFVLCTRFYPKSDPSKMLRIAGEILDHDYHEFETGEYLFKYPYQSGFIFYCMGAIRIFGDRAFFALQMLNALWLTAVLFFLGKSTELLWGYDKKQRSLATLAFMAGSVPLSLYVTFIYGNIPGMAFSVAGIYLELLYLQRRKPLMMIGSAVCIGLATVLKSNCLIFLVAMLLVLLVELAVSKRKVGTATACGALILFYLVFNRGVSMGMEAFTGQELGKGLPESAFVMMGLEEGFAAPGTENGSSTRIFTENNYDYGATDRFAREKIFAYLEDYGKDWRSGLDFFGRKQAAQCNEATFQGLSINTDRKTDISVPGWLQSLLYGEGSLILARVLDVVHTLLLFGVLFYVCTLSVKKGKIWHLLFLIAYIGDFLFQLFWEAKSQYMVIFFFVLLPYAVQGYRLLLHKLEMLSADPKKAADTIRLNRKRLLLTGAALLLALPLCARVMKSKTFSCIIALESEESVKQEYYEIAEDVKARN